MPRAALMRDVFLQRTGAVDDGDTGEFPVDHRDAAFALNLTRLLLAYLARLSA